MPKFTRVDHDPFARGELDGAFVATAPQKEIWLGAWIGGADANRAFNECLVLQLRGALCRSALGAAYRCLIERRDALRTTFSVDGEWGVVGHMPHPPPLRLVDLSASGEKEQALEIARLRDAEVTHEFDLMQGPLHRAALVALGEEQHLLFFSAHHIVCDWWSAGVLMQELAALYRRELDGALPPMVEAPRFIRYARSQIEREQGELGASDRAFWLELLGDYECRWELPADHPRTIERTYSSRRAEMSLGETESREVEELSRRHACTTTVTWLALLQTWLLRTVGAIDIVIGVPSAGQVTWGEPRLVGHCVHLLPVRLRCHAQETFAGVVARAKASLLACLEHSDVTYSALLGDLARVRKPGQLPLVSVTLNVDHGLPVLDFGALSVGYQTLPRRYEMFELSINVVVGERVRLEFNYNTGLFGESTVQRWMHQLRELAAGALASPRASLSALCALR